MVNLICNHLNQPSLDSASSTSNANLVSALPDTSKPKGRSKLRDKTWIRLSKVKMGKVSLIDFSMVVVSRLPKAYLEIAVTNIHGPTVLLAWRDNATVSFDLDITAIGQIDWFNIPVIHSDNNHLLFCVEDYHNLNIHWQMAVIKDQIDGIVWQTFKMLQQKVR